MAIGSTLLKAAVPAAITAGASIFSRPSSQQRTFLNQLGQLQTGATEAAGQLRTAGTGLVSGGQETMRAPVDYWSKILRGDRGAVLSAVAPEVRQIETGYEGARRGLELMPRGGGRSALMSQLPFEQQRDVSTLIQGARPVAAQALLGAGQGQQQIGAGLLSSSAQQLQAATQAGRELLQQQELQRQRDIATGQSIAQPIFDWLTKGAGGAAGTVAKAGAGAAGAAGLLGGGAGSLASIPSAAALAPGAASAGLLGGSGAAAAGVPTGAAAGGGLLSTIGGLATNPITLAAAGALGAGLIWKKSQAHPTADKWVQSQQNPFDQTMANVDRSVQSGQINPQQAQQIKQSNATEYLNHLREFAAKGGKERTVAQQALATFRQYYGDPSQYGVQVML